MTTFIKRFQGVSPRLVRREADLQRRASVLGFAPSIRRTDDRNYIEMDKLDYMTVADMYGEDIENVPIHLRYAIVELLWTLYQQADIQYVNVTPYNFIEHNERVWCIDFGHAIDHHHGMKLDSYLKNVFSTWKLTEWNPLFL
jgi:tRNA A-37 threonylcarbamoyl transferase component Bud32